MIKFLKSFKDYLIIKRSGLFDPAYYLINNPDVRKADVNPLMHFIKYGWREGRNPSICFDTKFYLAQNADVKRAGINPLFHYLRFGKIEGRSPKAETLPDQEKKKKLTNEDQKLLYTSFNQNDLIPTEIIQNRSIIETNKESLSVNEEKLEKAEYLANYYKHELEAIRQTNTYQFMLKLRQIRLIVAPHETLRGQLLNKLIQFVKRFNTRDLRKKEDYENDSKFSFNFNLDKSLIKEPKSFDIFVFPIIDWYFRYQRPQQISSVLASLGHRVFYFNSSFNIGSEIEIDLVKDNVYLITLPGYENSNIHSINMTPKMLTWCVQIMNQIALTFHVDQVVSLVDHPFWTPLALHLREMLGWYVVYDLMDFHKGFTASSPKCLIDEERLLEDSDLVIASSHPLVALASVSRKPIFVPNAGEFLHFNRAAYNISSILHEFKRPIIGYYGAISDWFDTNLVGYLGTARPEWTFILIGDTLGADLEPINKLPNIHLLGEKPYTELPDYLSGFDVCIIPFKKIPLTEATNPVKLFEFMSAGKPVVVTRLRELTNYEDYVELVESKDEWLDEIQKALDENKSIELLQKRFSFAKKNTWEERGKIIENAMIQLFPKISIIIVTYNNLDYTKLCIESVFSNTYYPNYEVIIVDNASVDDTPEYFGNLLKTTNRLKIIKNLENKGFAAANNQGAAISDGEYLVFLNNDTYVTPGWLNGLYKHIINNPKIGLLGPVTNNTSNEARIEVPYANLRPSDLSVKEVLKFSQLYTIENKGQIFDIRMLALFCVIIRKELFEQVGGLDERFGIGLFEDDDLAMKIRQMGLEIKCAEDVFVHHFMRASFSKLSQIEYKKLFLENKKKYEEKWKMTWIPHKGY